MITIWGIGISLLFLVCYLGQSVSSGMEGSRAKLLQWACWLVASGTMLSCYLLTRSFTQ